MVLLYTNLYKLILKFFFYKSEFFVKIIAFKRSYNLNLAIFDLDNTLLADDSVVLVLMNDEYQPYEIYGIDRESLEENAASKESNRGKRGAMTVARFKKIAALVWSSQW